MERKLCRTCGIDKNIDNFCWKNFAKGKRSPRCRSCHSKANKKYYLDDKATYIARARTHTVAYRTWFVNLKSLLSCSECGETHIACLDFHHTDPAEKEEAISIAVYSGWAKPRVLAEIAKCQILCSNCHRKLHYSLKYPSSKPHQQDQAQSIN